jgi:TonB family protein
LILFKSKEVQMRQAEAYRTFLEKETLMKVQILLIVTLTVASLSVPTFARSNRLQDEKHKGEVDLLVEHLNERKEPVLKHCLENCQKTNESNANDSVKVGAPKNKVQPTYPPIARAAHATGEVVVMVVVDEEGNVIAAQAVSGHPLLQAASVKAARESTFEPTTMDGRAVKVMGTISYNFKM